MKEGEVADKNRGRSVDDGDDRPDDVDDEFDELDDDADEADAADDEPDDAVAGRDTAPARSRKKATAGVVTRSRPKDANRNGGGFLFGIFGRLARFVREIVAELQKVIWPTRKELLTYTTVVVVFVAIMMTFVSLLDVGFAKVMFYVFGNGNGTTATTK